MKTLSQLLSQINNLRSNPRRLFSFHASSNVGHYQSTMTSCNDPRVHDVMSTECIFSKNAKQARILHQAHTFITLRDDRHIRMDQNSLTGIDRH